MTADVIVIGTGQAGVPLAVRLAAAGRRVLIVERGPAGGTCSNTGCTPTKTMIASARAAHVARTAGRLGVRVGAGPQAVTVDFPAVVARKDAIVRRWREGVEKRLHRAGERLTFLRGHARFVGPHEIEIDGGGERHRADTIIVNVGAHPAAPPLPGLNDVPWLDNAAVMALPALPAHLLVLGGGYIGCELGQLFKRLGAAVTIIERSPRLLSALDDDVSAAITAAFQGEGIAVECGTEARAVAVAQVADGQGVAVCLADGRQLVGSHLLVAGGRRPSTDDLGCDRAGIARDGKGFVVVDDGYQTSVPGVYAVGDVVNQPQFTHVAWDDHRILFDRLLGRSQRGRGGRLIPYTVFTDPQIAGVGLSEREARDKGVTVEMATMPFGHVARAIELDETAGLIKVLIDPATERIVGATIVGAEAGELIHVFVAAMQAGASARTLVDAQFVHPAFAEGLQTALMKLPRYALS